MDELPSIERSVIVPAEPHEVWDRIISGEVPGGWMGLTIEPRVGGAVEIEDRDMIGAVEEVVEGVSITWSWRERTGEPSQVVIRMSPVDDGTEITVVERLLRYEISSFPPTMVRWFAA